MWDATENPQVRALLLGKIEAMYKLWHEQLEHKQPEHIFAIRPDLPDGCP
ncbi:MAG: hypothetical protein L0I94_12550 [Yaniella sp.]|nr:hypothetical protein [Yaniella sp.]MDN5703868.1 hypothetical protein [Yaniella sp.]MDN5732556.1 hypothetical protein [Yaniella sp.]MDN6149634.1 hypothetical protein [Yaniella sp.]MDN6150640.1 hypothetical protein [Yaniella sp.]MDN6358979.1 hypothetical protein [Yaniella sp.]